MKLVLSLFPGIGLLDMAFEEQGDCVVRGPDVLWGGDIRKFHPPAGKFDGVIGGPPCQMFSSLARLVIANGHQPKFGNLIPEYERVISEAIPDWFVMENVPQAPTPVVDGYGVKSFILNNAELPGNDGPMFGQEQERVRRFSFGMFNRKDIDVPSLLKFIDVAMFLLPDAEPNQMAYGKGPTPSQRTRQKAVFGDGRPTRQEHRHRVPTVTSTDGGTTPSEKRRTKAVSSSAGGRAADGTLNNARRYRFADACRLQGLPEDFLADAPFTAEGKLKAVANGVPLPMGRAIAKAVREAISA